MRLPAVAIAMLATQILAGLLAADEAEVNAIAAIIKLGGKTKGQPVTDVHLEKAKLDDADLEHLAAFKQLRKLWLHDTNVTDAGFKHLIALKELKELYANGAKATDIAMKHLAALEKLEKLSLEYAGVTDAGLKELTALKRLQKLWLSTNSITDAGLKEIVGGCFTRGTLFELFDLQLTAISNNYSAVRRRNGFPITL